MAISLFISEDKLKRSTTINGNVDVELLRPYMKVGQDLHIWTKLGSKLYNKLQDMVADGSINDPGNADYKALIDDYIQDALVHWTLYEAIPFLGYKIMNKDIVRQTSETSTTASMDELNYLRNIVMNTAEWYTERLIDHLCQHNSLYPEYNTNEGDDVRPDKNNYNNGMNLGHRGYKGSQITLRDFLDNSIM